MRIYLLIFISLIISTSMIAQEICNNSIDDDGDGLIDILDPDCDCDQILPSGLIPNESFEIMECCPVNEAEFNCATDWQQAAPTSDYFHTCGITYPTWITPAQQPPQPLPDGNGYVGFRDGKRQNRPNYKEYVGACLTDQMEVGKVYTLDFYLGFPLSNNSIEMTIYGTTVCSNLPFTNNYDTGCPTNFAGWDQLDQQFIQGDTEWLNVTFDLYADKPFTAIILGPGCDPNPNFNNDPYFYVDRLNLVEKVDEGLPFTNISGSLCEEEITLQLDLGDEFDYQWYKDGIAISGETSNTIILDVDIATEGGYSIVITTPAGCVLSETFDLTIPVLESTQDVTICEGETYLINGIPATTSGIYTNNLTSMGGCDSIATINLTVLSSSLSTFTPTICEGDSYDINGESLTTSGSYNYNLESANGCDSIITVFLTVVEELTTIEAVNICEGETYYYEGTPLTSTGSYPYTYITASGCDSIYTIDLTVRQIYTNTEDVTICQGEQYPFGNNVLTSTGMYFDEFNSIFGCDSNVILNLTVSPPTYSQIEETICEGESYNLAGTEYNMAGSYQATVPAANNCDSTIFLQLDLVTWADGVTLPIDTTIKLGTDLSVTAEYLAPEFEQVVWLDEMGNVLSNEDTLNLYNIVQPQKIFITAVDEYGCVDDDNMIIRINRDIGIFAPNIFSPNGDISNNYFRPIVNNSIAALKEISIYDRWGNIVYYRDNITDLSSWRGWDGKINGKIAIQGVYVYLATFLALDGQEEVIAGDITLVR